MKIKNIKDMDVRGKYVLLRDDFNVQVVDGKITDAFRIEQSMPTIDLLKQGGARVVICAHFGRPKGVRDEKLSLKPVAEYLGVKLIPDCLDKNFMRDMKDGDVVLMENVRFYAEEETNNLEFAKELSSGFDLYVNDAFAVSHRAHASTVGVTNFLPSYAGLLLSGEIEKLSALLENAKRPLLLIAAGGKVSTKLGLLQSFVKIADKIIVGGGIGNTFAYAMGHNVGDSLHEPDMKDQVLDIMKMALDNNCEILMPIDKGVASEFNRNAERTNKSIDEIGDDDIIMDAGVQTSARNAIAIKDSRTVIWNGPVGMAEWIPTWSYGSFEIARAIATQTSNGKLNSVIGGGDTVAVFEALGLKGDVSYLSTGGGAFMEFLEGKVLPGIKALEIK